MDLQEVDTCELMQELSKREGVEKIRIPPNGRSKIVATRPWEKGDEDHKYYLLDGITYIHDGWEEGHMVILSITD